MRKTTLMETVEERYQQPLVAMLPQMLTEQGLAKTAEEIGVSKATLGTWMAQLGIELRYVALRPGESIAVVEQAPRGMFARFGARLRRLAS